MNIINHNEIKRDLDMNSYVYLPISKKEVEKKDYEHMEEVFKGFKEAGVKGRKKLIITFSGYETIPDEIFEIIEIREYVEELFNKHPYFFYYITKESGLAKLLFFCLCDIETYYEGDRKPLAFIEARGEIQMMVRHNIDTEKVQMLVDETVKYALSIGDDEEGLDEVFMDLGVKAIK
jgi:hypothetical protein